VATMERATFDKLSPADRWQAMKAGTQLTDSTVEEQPDHYLYRYTEDGGTVTLSRREFEALSHHDQGRIGRTMRAVKVEDAA
jgi:hypothetical protein